MTKQDISSKKELGPSRVKPLTSLGRLGRLVLKRLMYSQMMVNIGLRIAIGKEEPLVKFTVEKAPPSIYWVFQIKPSMIDSLTEQIGLPPGFSLSPIKCLESDTLDYLMVVNAYRVSGLVNGLRAEWSVFVRDGSDTPYYMIVDALSSKPSMDPISIITKSSTVVHEMENGKIYTQIGDEGRAFKSTISFSDSAPFATSSRDWVSANDRIYWGNGISDRTFYDSGLANARQRRIDNASVNIINDSVWGPFLEAEPFHTLVLEDAIEFVISPWENVDRVRVE